MKHVLVVSLTCLLFSFSSYPMEAESERSIEEGFINGNCLPHEIKSDAYSYYEGQETSVLYRTRNAGSIANKTMSGSIDSLLGNLVSPEIMSAMHQLITIVNRLDDRVAKIEHMLERMNKHE